MNDGNSLGEHDEEYGEDYMMDDDEAYEYEEEDDVVMTQEECDSTRRSNFNNTFDYLMPDAALALKAAEDLENMAEFEESEQKKRRTNNEDPSNKLVPWWDCGEYLAIFQALKYIIKNCHAFQMSLDWDHLNRQTFRQPLLTVTSKKSVEIVYIFNLSFQSTTQGVFPEVPPKIIPHFSMPAPLYFFTSHFPLLTMKYWNPCQDLVGVIEILCSLWDEVLATSSRYASSMYAGPLLNGSISAYPESPKELNEFVSASNEDCSFEVLLSLWFGTYQNECNYDFGDLHNTLNRLSSGRDDANEVSSDGGDANKTYSSLSSIQNILAACPKQIHHANKAIPRDSGIGYSKGSGSNHVKIERPLRMKVLEKISSKLAIFSSTDLSSADSNSQIKRIGQWLLESPLLHLIAYELSQMSSGDALHQGYDLVSYFTLVNFVDRMIERMMSLNCTSDVLQVLSPSQRQIITNIFHISKIRWIDTGMFDDLDNDGPTVESGDMTQNTTVPAAQTISSRRAVPTPSSTPSKPIDREALAEFKVRLMEWCKDISVSEEEVSNIAAPPKGLLEEVEKVFFIDGLENHSIFKGELDKGSKCPKFFIRELKTLNESLSNNIRVYAAEACPNILKVVMFIENDECPYYGGSYLFDVFIPSEYPAISPKVTFLTTGRGTVRFNPNLYQCGKVCLSLLGTWSGEPWDPKTSNLTQVLNSILFLIFTKDPYYNEPGYSKNEKSLIQSEHYDAEVLFNSIEFAMVDYFKAGSANVTGCDQILFDIHEHYLNNWSRICPIVTQKMELYSSKTTDRKRHDTARSSVQHISQWVEKNKK